MFTPWLAQSAYKQQRAYNQRELVVVQGPNSPEITEEGYLNKLKPLGNA